MQCPRACVRACADPAIIFTREKRRAIFAGSKPIMAGVAAAAPPRAEKAPKRPAPGMSDFHYGVSVSSSARVGSGRAGGGGPICHVHNALLTLISVALVRSRSLSCWDVM